MNFQAFFRSTNSIAYISSWSVSQVQHWFMTIGIKNQRFRSELKKWKVNGKRLVKMNEYQIKFICYKVADAHFAHQVKKRIFSIQKQYRQMVQRKRKNEIIFEPARKRQKLNNQTRLPVRLINYDVNHSGERWTESELRNAYYLFKTKEKNFKQIGKLLKRSETAVLTKINLIRRAFKETNQTDADNPYYFKGSYMDIVEEQKAKEEDAYQNERMFRAND
eukprot:129438_1